MSCAPRTYLSGVTGEVAHSCMNCQCQAYEGKSWKKCFIRCIYSPTSHIWKSYCRLVVLQSKVVSSYLTNYFVVSSYSTNHFVVSSRSHNHYVDSSWFSSVRRLVSLLIRLSKPGSSPIFEEKWRPRRGEWFGRSAFRRSGRA